MVSMVETVKCVTMLYFMKVELLQRYGDLAVFKMAAVRHLGFAVRVFGPPTVIKTIKCALWVTKHTHHKSKVEYCV